MPIKRYSSDKEREEAEKKRNQILKEMGATPKPRWVEEEEEPIIHKYLLEKKLKAKQAQIEPPKKQRAKSPVSVARDFEETPKKRGRPKKVYKEEEIMKGKSELLKRPDGKYAVETDLKIKADIAPKVKQALKKSIIHEAQTELKGYGLKKKLVLDFSSDDEPPSPPRLRRTKAKGKGYDSSSDEEDIREYGDILKHLIKHIRDPKEKIDPEDYKQAIELIKKIKQKKR